jgi:integrase
MSLYKRGRVYHYTFYALGRRWRGSTKQTNEKKAEKVEALILAKILEQGEVRGSRRVPVLSEFSTKFFQWVDGSRLEPGTRTYYKVGWKLLSTTLLRGMRLDRITPAEVDSVQVGQSPSNTNNALRTLRRMLFKAHEWKVITTVPRIKLVKEYGRSVVLEPWMEQKLLAVTEVERSPVKKHSPLKGVNYTWQPFRDVLIIMLDSGMRPAEVFRMRWEDVKWDRSSIFIPFGKSPKARRHVAMSDRVRDLLKARGVKTSGWVFPANRSESGHIETVQKQYSAARKLAGIPDGVVLYCARHRYGTDALSGTGNLAAVMDSMGHSHAQTAMIYQHPHLNLVRDAINRRNVESSAGHKSGHSDQLVQ